MTHVFLVKSLINYLVAAGVVRHLGLAREDVIMLAVRGFEPPDPDFEIVTLPYGPEVTLKIPAQIVNGIASMRGLLKRLAERGGGFYYYTTNSRQVYNQILMTHPRCAGFSFLECGFISYQTRDYIETLYPTKRSLVPDRRRGWRLGVKTYYRDDYEAVYGVGYLSFPGFSRRVELEDVFEGRYDGDASEVDNVLVYDGMSAHRRVATETVRKAVDRTVRELRESGARSLHYKFHPAQTFKGEDRVLEAALREVAGDIALHRLPESAALEGLAAARPSARFFVGVSSAGIYAVQLGCQVLSYAQYIVDVDPGFQQYADQIPAAIRRDWVMLGA